MTILDCLLICLIAYAAFAALREVYWAIRLQGFGDGVEAAKPVMAEMMDRAFAMGRIHERATVQSEVQDIYKEGFRQGRLSTVVPTIFERN